MRQLGLLPVSEGGWIWAQRRLQGWKMSTDVTHSWAILKPLLPCHGGLLEQYAHQVALCCVGFYPSPQIPTLQTQPFPKALLWTLKMFPPQWNSPAGSTAVSHCNEVTDAVSPADLLIAARKFVLNLFPLVLPSKVVSSASLSPWPQPEQQLGQSSQQPLQRTGSSDVAQNKTLSLPLEGYSASARRFSCSNCFNVHLHER